MVFNELAHIFSDDDNQHRSREVLNRVSSYTLSTIWISFKFYLHKLLGDNLDHYSEYTWQSKSGNPEYNTSTLPLCAAGCRSSEHGV